jgi:hypothetical protein
MRTTTAYFAGVGTVVAAVALGLGGGLLISNVVSPHEPKTEMSRLEQRMSSKPIPVSNAPSEPVPYLAATQAIPSAATTSESQPQPPAPTPGTETVAANPPSPPDAVPAVQVPQPAPREQAAVPENAFAKARDADVKRVTEKRKAERRQQWTERRRHLQRQDQELREVEEKVREETEPRQAFRVEPARLEMPRIRLFEAE